MIIALPRRIAGYIAMWSVVALLLNFLAVRLWVVDDLQETSLDSLAGKRVVIDPGHGGIDNGASGFGILEKDVTLSLSRKLAETLSQHGAAVSLTRDEDIDYYTRGKGGKRNDLLKRSQMIMASGADVFVSIHCNAIRGMELTGAQVFYHPKREENKSLAEIMQRALKEFPPGNRRQAKEDLHILLLNATDVPGILIETGYLTSQKEAVLLADEAYQQKMAGQIAKGLAYHFSHSVGR